MRKEKRIADLTRMYRSMTDLEAAKEDKRKADLLKRKSDGMLDVGL
jgi:hypothetical protein